MEENCLGRQGGPARRIPAANPGVYLGKWKVIFLEFLPVPRKILEVKKSPEPRSRG
jgi:hypothetical protein